MLTVYGASGALALAAVVLSRRGVRLRWLLPLGLLPILCIYLLVPYHLIYSYHGFWHISLVHEIQNGSIPPENPLFAGAPASYPWAHHAVVAAVGVLLGVTPPWTFAALNVLLLLAGMSLIHRVARRLIDDRRAGVMAVALALFATTPMTSPVLWALWPGRGGLGIELPAAMKFSNVNSTPFGIVCFTLWLLATLRLFDGCKRRLGRDYLLTFLATTAAGLFYPFHFTAIVASACACALLVLVHSGRAALPGVVGYLAAVGIAGFCVLPYLLALTGSETGSAVTLATPEVWLSDLGLLAAVVSPAILVACWRPRVIGAIVRTAPGRILLSCAATNALLFVALTVPEKTQTKYLMIACLALGVLLAPGFSALATRRPLVCTVVLAFFFAGFAEDGLAKLRSRAVPRADLAIVDGPRLRTPNADADVLYSWIAEQTEPTAIFVDSTLDVPVFGARPLFVGMDLRLHASHSNLAPEAYYRGWLVMKTRSIEESFLHGVSGLSRWQIHLRRHVAELIQNETRHAVSDYEVDALAKAAGDRPLYVIARGRNVARKLARDGRFEPTFRSGAIEVYRLAQRPQSAGK